MIHLLDVATGREVLRLKGHEGWTKDLLFGPDGRTLISVGMDDFLKVWDTKSAKCNLQTPCSNLTHLAFVQYAGNAYWLRYLHGKGVELRDLLTDALTWFGSRSIFVNQYSICVSPNLNRIAHISKDSVYVYDREKSEDISIPNPKYIHDPKATFVSSGGSYDGQFYNDAACLITTNCNEVRTWDLNSRMTLLRYKPLEMFAEGIRVSPDNSEAILFGSSGTQVWDLSDGQVRTLNTCEHPCQINCPAFSEDGRFLAIGRNNAIELLDAKTKGVLWIQPIEVDYFAQVLALSFSPDMNVLAVGRATCSTYIE